MFNRVLSDPLGVSSRSSGAVARGQQQAERNADEIRELERRIDHLALLNYALWTLLEERTGLTEAELQARVQEIDLKDGKLDGRYEGGVETCPQCGQTLSRRLRRCLYCDYQAPLGTFEGAIS